MRELLPVEYFHVVFTLPDCFNALALQNKRVVYDLLFRAASQTLLRIGADPKHLGAEIGFTAVLHTWGQNLTLHPHLHCIAAGGGLRGDQWVSCRKGFFLPVRVLSRQFRSLFLKFLKLAFDRAELEFHGSSERSAFPLLLRQAASMEWVVYAKRPFGGPAQVLQYLGQYTHRVAISNHRLLKLEAGQVVFNYRDYRDHNLVKQMSLPAHEFIRRFLLHILPDGFQRIRHFGFLSSRCKAEKLPLCSNSLGLLAGSQSQSQSKQPRDWKSRCEQLTGLSVDACPVCRQGRMQKIEILNPLRSFPIIEGIDSS
jgi:hypothetical protein